MWRRQPSAPQRRARPVQRRTPRCAFVPSLLQRLVTWPLLGAFVPPRALRSTADASTRRSAAAQAARGAAAVAALRRSEAHAAAQKAARDAVAAEAAASVAAVLCRAGARTLPEALAAFGVAVGAGESQNAAFRRAALLFHPDRVQAVGGDELATWRAKAEAAEKFKALTQLRAD